MTAGEWLRIDQAAHEIRIARVFGRPSVQNPPASLTISLEGKESSNTYYGVHRPGLTGSISSKAHWNADRLVILTIHTIYDAEKKTSTKKEITETLSFDGARLAIERSVSPMAGKPRKEVWIKR